MNLSLLILTGMFCQSAFEYKTGDPESLFPHHTAIHDYTTPVVMRTSALLPFADGFLFNSYAGRPYSGENIASRGSTIQYGAEKYGIQISWNMFGADFYMENICSLCAGYTIFSFLHAGISENLYTLKINMSGLSENRKFTDTDISLLFTPFPWLNAAFTQTGIATLIKNRNSETIYPERSTGILIKPGKGFSLIWNITDTAVEKVNSFETIVNPTSFFSIKGGYCMEKSSFTTTFGILVKKFFVSYGLKYHPYLGYSHSIGISYAMNPEIETLHYGTPLFSLFKKKINIQTATPEDLEKLMDCHHYPLSV